MGGRSPSGGDWGVLDPKPPPPRLVPVHTLCTEVWARPLRPLRPPSGPKGQAQGPAHPTRPTQRPGAAAAPWPLGHQRTTRRLAEARAPGSGPSGVRCWASGVRCWACDRPRGRDAVVRGPAARVMGVSWTGPRWGAAVRVAGTAASWTPSPPPPSRTCTHALY